MQSMEKKMCEKCFKTMKDTMSQIVDHWPQVWTSREYSKQEAEDVGKHESNNLQWVIL